MISRLFTILWLFLIGVSCSRHEAPTQEPCSCIPFYFLSSSHRNLPIIDVEIDGVKYPCGLDLGSNVGHIVLREEVLQKINAKTLAGDSSTLDFQGNVYRKKKYVLPFIKLNEWEIENVTAVEESMDYLKNTLLFATEAEKQLQEDLSSVGRIGINIFAQYVCFLDFHNSKIVLSEKVDRNICESWKETSLDTLNGLALMSFETDLGIKTFLLDTGAGASLFREALVDKAALLPKNTVKQSSSGRWFFRSLAMKVGNIDFGEQRFILLDLDLPYKGIDGILGIDFFKKQPMYLDFPNSKAYLQPPQRSLWNMLWTQFAPSTQTQ